MSGKPWIEWHGGNRPGFAPGDRADVKTRDGETLLDCLPLFLVWEHLYGPRDIVSYRVSDSDAVRSLLSSQGEGQ